MAEHAAIYFEALGDTSDTEYLKSLAFNEKRYKNIGKTVAKRIIKKAQDKLSGFLAATSSYYCFMKGHESSKVEQTGIC